MTELEQFNDQFPNSKYREIYPQYVGKVETAEEIEKYQNSKAPINKEILTFDQIKDTKNRIGWIVPKDYVVIDIDSKTDASIIFKILDSLSIKFSFMIGRKGGHFIFKNNRNVGNGAKYMTSLGIVVDCRGQEKGYIILPQNDTDRKWGTISNFVDNIPFFLTPLKHLKCDFNFIGMENGDGRNDSLFKHFLAMKDYATEITLQEQIDSIKVINRFLFKTPIKEDELETTVLRIENVEKPSKQTKKKSDDEEGVCREEKIAAKIIRDNTIITTNDSCYIWNGKFYRKIDNMEEIERLIHLNYRSDLKAKDRREIIEFIKLKSWIDPKELNKNWNEMVFKNGVLNLSTMKLYPHDPKSYNTIYVDYDYIENAPYSSIIDDFFNTISSNEEDKKILLYEIVGYCLLKQNPFSKLFICYGEGGTGKSTYLKVIKNLIGSNNSSFLSLNDLEKDFKAAELFGKLVNLGDDIPYNGIKDTAVLKKLTSGEMFAASQKFIQHPLNFSNFAKLIFTSNKLPEIADRTSGLYRRLYLIEINKKIEKPDIFFMLKLTDADYEYLLYKGVEAVYNALKRGTLTECITSSISLEDYKVSQSSVLTFVKEYDYDAKYLDTQPCMEVFARYREYCEKVGFRPLKKTNFDKELCDNFKLEKVNTTKDGINQTWRYRMRGR